MTAAAPLRFPFLRPNPASLLSLLPQIAAMEARRQFTNNGPFVRDLEARFDAHWGIPDSSVAVCNATLGLTLAMRHQAARRPGARYALMPSFTFAATAQAAIWAGLEPLFCDIDPRTWLLDPRMEADLLARHGDAVAVIVPCATFGSAVDIDHYTALAEATGIPVVIDAAASLGALDAAGRPVGRASPHPIVFSMHATKTFSVGEAGLVHCADPGIVAAIRAMANYGFRAPRSASMPGLNAKLSEVMALLALAKFRDFEALSAHRAELAATYRRRLPGWTPQLFDGRRQAFAFMPLLVPADLGADRDALVAALTEAGIECGRYFHPHVAEQPFFQPFAAGTSLLETTLVANRVIAFPLWDELTVADVEQICAVAARVAGTIRQAERLRRTTRRAPIGTAIIGGGPAGLAVLLAGSRAGRLPALLERGLAVVDAGDRLGDGRLGSYAIDSDSAAATFLHALDDLPEPALASLHASPEADAVRAAGATSAVSLDLAGRLLRRTGAALGDVLRSHRGGHVLGRTRALYARRTARGTWDLTVQGPEQRETMEVGALVLACGAGQSFERLRRERAFNHVSLLPDCEDRLLRSDDLLQGGAVARLLGRFPPGRKLRVAILGSGSGAVSSARVLLREAPERFAAGSITVLHRSKLRLFYRSVNEAHDAGYRDFDERDICPVSGFVNRLGGLRFGSADLVRATGAHGFARTEDRVVFRLVATEGDPARAEEVAPDQLGTVRSVLDDADVVVAALGYRPNALKLYDVSGLPIDLSTGAEPLVDGSSRVRARDGRIVEGVWAIGLAAGFRTGGALGGEPSFSGQTNGLWLWQHDVGDAIARQALDWRPAPATVALDRALDGATDAAGADTNLELGLAVQ